MDTQKPTTSSSGNSVFRFKFSRQSLIMFVYSLRQISKKHYATLTYCQSHALTIIKCGQSALEHKNRATQKNYEHLYAVFL